MSFGQAIVRVFSNYANFQGRARRSEYWYFVLFYGIVMLCLSLLNIPPQTGQQNGGNRSRVTVEMSPGVRLQVQAVE